MKEFTGGTKMNNDIIENIGNGSVIQHGKHNDRIYLMKLDKRDMPQIFTSFQDLALKNKYSKIFCKVPKSMAPHFTANGFMIEAFIPEFYNQKEDVFFMSKFLNSDRILNIEKEELGILSDLLQNKPAAKAQKPPGFSFRKLTEDDIDAITDIYKEIFKSYPFPIHSASYIKETMNNNVQYYGAEYDGELAALSSSEIDFEGKNAEMTDFATSKKFKGKKLASILLSVMENEMKQQGINTLYTIARLRSVPMNKTFLRLNYQYSGTLIKNTNISGNIESMNVYYKHL